MTDEVKNLGEPLTIEELRGMKDKPAYLHVFDKNLESGWHIIKTVTQGKVIFRGWNKVYVPVDALGTDYNLYRYKPVETGLQPTCNDVATVVPKFEFWPEELNVHNKAWEPCVECKTCRNCKNQDDYDPYEGTTGECGQCYDMSNFDPVNFCHECGKPLTEEARTMLEKRLRGCFE